MTELFTYVLLPLGALLLALAGIAGVVGASGAVVRWRGRAFGALMLLLVVSSISSIVLSFRHLSMSNEGLMNVAEGDAGSGSGFISKLLLMAVVGCSGALCMAWIFDLNKKLRGAPRFVARGMAAPRGVVLAFMLFYVAFSLVPIPLGQRYYVHISLIYPFFVYLALFFYMQLSDIDPAAVAKLCLGLLVFGSLIAAVATPGAAFQPGYRGLIPGFSMRLWGVTAHANSLGAVACAYVLVEVAEPARRRWLHLLALGGAGLVMLMSQSKTSVLTAMLGCGVIYGTRAWAYVGAKNRGYSRNSGLFMAALLLFLCVAVALAGAWLMFFDLNLLASIERKLDSRAVGDIGTGTGRLYIWAAAFKAGMENPLFGQGAGFWNLETRLRLGLSGAVTAHNLYLQVFSRSGLVGLVGLLGFLFVLTKYALRAGKATGGASVAMLLVLLLRAMTEVPIAPNSILSAEFFATMAYIFYIIDRGARHLPETPAPLKERLASRHAPLAVPRAG